MSKSADPTPLTILSETMRETWADGDRDAAAALARTAAPYLDARRAAVRQPIDQVPEPDRLTDAEIAQRLAAADHRERDRQAGTGEPD